MEKKLLKTFCLFIILLTAGCGNPDMDTEGGQDGYADPNLISGNESVDIASDNESGDMVSGNEGGNILEEGETIVLSNGLYADVRIQVSKDLAIEGITEWIRIQNWDPNEGNFDTASDNRRILIPNIFGTITDIRMENYSKISIYYKDGEGGIGQAAIPLDFYASEGNVVEPMFRWEPGRCVCFNIEELMNETVFPKEVWSEKFASGGEDYTAIYSRISPIYKADYIEGMGCTADYQFTILQGDRILYEVKLYQMRVKYEEVHYMEDVNGDGVEDFIQLNSVDGYLYATPYVFVWDQEQETCIYGGPISLEEKALYELPNGKYDDPIYSSVCYDKDSRTFYDDSWMIYGSDYNINDRIVSCGARFVDGEWKTVYEMYLGGGEGDYARETRYDEEGNVVSETICTEAEYSALTTERYDTYDLDFTRFEGYTQEQIIVNEQFSYSKYVRDEE